jgi:ABC-type multidrug transport system ATPase subunit
MAEQSAPILRISGVSKSFGRHRVLREVSVQAAAGHVIGLLGRNGTGKTTLFRLVHDLLDPDEGTIEVFGRPLDGSGRVRAVTGHLPDRPQFHARWTPRNILRWRARLIPEFSLERAERWAAGLGLGLEKKWWRPSVGQACKLAWVCACAHLPKLVLLDEPTNGLDYSAREYALHTLLPELRASGATVIVANHHMGELASLLTQLWIIRDQSLHVVGAELSLERFRASGLISDYSQLPAEIPKPVRCDGRYAVWLLNEAEFLRLAQSNLVVGLECEPVSAGDQIAALLNEMEGPHAPPVA